MMLFTLEMEKCSIMIIRERSLILRRSLTSMLKSKSLGKEDSELFGEPKTRNLDNLSPLNTLILLNSVLLFFFIYIK